MGHEKTNRAQSAAVKVLLAAGFSVGTGAAMADATIDHGMIQNVLPGVPFDAAGELTVGEDGLGRFNILSGGEATNTNAYIGSNLSGKGEVSVSGTDAKWINNGYLIIGWGGEGVVTVDGGASVLVHGWTDLAANGGSRGQLTLLGAAGARGVFSTSDILKGPGTGLLYWDGGILQARNNEANFLAGFAYNDIDIRAGGAFFDTQAYNVGIVQSDILIGTGGLTKLGTGTLNIAGGNSWSGDTAVTAGTLALGTYTQSGSQSLTIGVASSTNYGKLSVSGLADFANSNLIVDVIGSPALANNSTLTGVITAGTLNATSFTVTDNSALFDFAASITGNSVDLNVTTSSTGTTVYSSVLNNHLYPALGAAGVLDSQVQGTPTGDMANVVTAFGLLPDERSVARAAAQTLPLNSSANATLGVLDSFNSIFAGRFAPVPGDKPAGDAAANRNIWIAPFGAAAVQDDTLRNASGYTAYTGGLATGIEGQIGETQIGLAYAFGRTLLNGNSDLSGAGTSADINSHVVAAYGSHALEDFTLGFQVDVGWNKTESERSINFGGLNRTATGSFDSLSLHAGGSLSKAIVLDAASTFIPTLRADYTRLGSQGYTESGAGALSLDVDANTVQALILGVDGRVVHALAPNLQLDASFGVSYDAINDDGTLTASYAGAPGQSFVAAGIDRSAWLAKAGAGLTYNFDGGADVSMRYDARGWNGSLNHSVSLKAAGSF